MIIILHQAASRGFVHPRFGEGPKQTGLDTWMERRARDGRSWRGRRPCMSIH
jgi:hypothetical protein